jgi:hypothetical protein
VIKPAEKKPTGYLYFMKNISFKTNFISLKEVTVIDISEQSMEKYYSDTMKELQFGKKIFQSYFC